MYFFEFRGWKRSTAGRSTQEEAKYFKIFILMAQELTSSALHEIGEIVDLDHASILHHSKTGKGYLDVDIQFRKEYEKLLRDFIPYTESIEEELKASIDNILIDINTENYTKVEKLVLKQKLQELEF